MRAVVVALLFWDTEVVTARATRRLTAAGASAVANPCCSYEVSGERQRAAPAAPCWRVPDYAAWPGCAGSSCSSGPTP